MLNKKIIYSSKDVRGEFTKLYGKDSEFEAKRYDNLIARFNREFNENGGYMASSSGRVEVVGNHTDHNGGKAVACAISLDTVAVFLPTNNGIITLNSEGYDPVVVDVFSETEYQKGSSNALTKGICEGLKERGYKVGGFNAVTTSNVSGGAGVSSSASFELLVCEMLNFLYNDSKIDEKTKVKISQNAENKYFGKPCGLLDQSAIAFGGITLFDFSVKGDVTATKINNKLTDYTLVLIETGGDHKNLTGEYAAITEDMKAVSNFFNKERLIEVDKATFYNELPSLHKAVSGRAIMRAIHFFDENERVEKLANALNNNNYAEFLKMVDGSGISSLNLLQNCYVSGDVTQPIPTALAIGKNYLLGGVNRVHGGGFAGTILNILKNENVDNFVKEMSKIYGEKRVIPLKVREVGATIL